MKKIFLVPIMSLFIHGCATTASTTPQKVESINQQTTASSTISASPKASVQSISSSSKKPSVAAKSYTKKRVYTCANLSRSEAYAYLKAGHSYLDRDGDGHPCEWGKKKSLYKPTPKSNCHYVRGYYRKSGTYVSGHMRCR